jgi:hypothetical protein
MTPSNSRKQVTITFEGYRVEDAQKALIQRVLRDFPNASREQQAKALGLSGVGLAGIMKRLGIKPVRSQSKAEINAINLLKKRGYVIDATKVGSPKRGKRAIWDPTRLNNMEVGEVIPMPGLTVSTDKNYSSAHAKNQMENVRYTVFEDSEGTKLKRVR